MFERMWNKFPDEDIFILHADMTEYSDGWLEEVLAYVNKYPEAGMLVAYYYTLQKTAQINTRFSLRVVDL
jgi:GT2 family glycosyltransferase